MLHVCYMFAEHLTCFKASGYRGLRPVMLYGYMFLRNSFFIQHKGTEIQSFYYFSVSLYLCVYQNTACGLRSPLGIVPLPLKDALRDPWEISEYPHN